MAKLEDLKVGDLVKFVRGQWGGQIGQIVKFEGDQIRVHVPNTLCYKMHSYSASALKKVK